MLEGLIIGGAAVAFGIFMIVYRERFMDWRIRWFQGQNRQPNRQREMIAYLWGSPACIAIGIAFVVAALSD
jgi:hypothetical protein